MKILSNLTLLVLIISVFNSCKSDVDEPLQYDAELQAALEFASATNDLDWYTMPESNQLDQLPQDPNNPLTAAKVELGKLLYHETGLALNPKDIMSLETYSCSSCHFAEGGFQANKAQGIAEGGLGYGFAGEGRYVNPAYPIDSIDLQPIRSPSVLNTVYQKCLLWNGQFGATDLNEDTEAQWTPGTPKEKNFLGYEGLETQAIAGLDVHRMKIDLDMLTSTGYKAMFDDAFSDWDESERYSSITAGLAIAAYERTILSNRSGFQKWLKGDKTAMTDKQKQGAVLFFDKANCYQCHNGPGLNNMEFHAIGMNDLDGPGVYGASADDVENLGRGGFTQVEADMYKFKVPQLYNLKNSPHYGHGASFTSVEDVVRYKNEAIAENSSVPASKLSEHFVALDLTESEIDALTEFLVEGLYDGELMRYQPASVLSGLCFPNNDPQSRVDLGCE